MGCFGPDPNVCEFVAPVADSFQVIPAVVPLNFNHLGYRQLVRPTKGDRRKGQLSES